MEHSCINEQKEGSSCSPDDPSKEEILEVPVFQVVLSLDSIAMIRSGSRRYSVSTMVYNGESDAIIRDRYKTAMRTYVKEELSVLLGSPVISPHSCEFLRDLLECCGTNRFFKGLYTLPTCEKRVMCVVVPLEVKELSEHYFSSGSNKIGKVGYMRRVARFLKQFMGFRNIEVYAGTLGFAWKEIGTLECICLSNQQVLGSIEVLDLRDCVVYQIYLFIQMFLKYLLVRNGKKFIYVERPSSCKVIW